MRRLDGLLQGDHRGLVPGHGSETGETRPYVPGDDIRRIDWNVSARSTHTHVRETIAERELETWVAVDGSARLHFGTATSTKAAVALGAVGAVAVLTARSGNRVGAVIGTPEGIVSVPARSGRKAMSALLSIVAGELAPQPPDVVPGRSDLTATLSRLLRPPRRRGLVVVVSDLLDRGRWDGPLRALTNRHEVMVVQVLDPRELELPAVGMIPLADVETGRVRHVRTDRRSRERFAEGARRQQADLADRIRSAGADHVVLRTDRDWVVDLARHVRDRRASGSIR